MMFSVTSNYDDTYGSDGICSINEVEMSLMVIKHNITNWLVQWITCSIKR